MFLPESSNASDLYAGDDRFESRPEAFLWLSTVPPVIRWDSNSIRPNCFVFMPLAIRYSLIAKILDIAWYEVLTVSLNKSD
jgi:hypothetical protein